MLQKVKQLKIDNKQPKALFKSGHISSYSQAPIYVDVSINGSLPERKMKWLNGWEWFTVAVTPCKNLF